MITLVQNLWNDKRNPAAAETDGVSNTCYNAPIHLTVHSV